MSEIEDMELLTELKGVKLYADRSKAVIKSDPFGGVPWGEYYKVAPRYRSPADIHSEIPQVVAAGEIFEVLWEVSNHWLWKNTTDRVMSSHSIKEVAESASSYEIEYEDSLRVAEAVWQFINDNPTVQDRILESRNERLGRSDVRHENIERIDFSDHIGSYRAEDILYTNEIEHKYIETIENRGWNIDPEERLAEIEEKVDQIDDSLNPVISYDDAHKPMRSFLHSEIILKTDHARYLEKVVQVAPHRDDISISVDLLYDEGDAVIQIEESG